MSAVISFAAENSCEGSQVSSAWVAAILLFAIAGATIGWRRATKPIYRRSIFDENSPAGMSRREYDRMIRHRRKLWRLLVTLFCALIGAAFGVVFLFLIARRL